MTERTIEQKTFSLPVTDPSLSLADFVAANVEALEGQAEACAQSFALNPGICIHHPTRYLLLQQMIRTLREVHPIRV